MIKALALAFFALVSLPFSGLWARADAPMTCVDRSSGEAFRIDDMGDGLFKIVPQSGKGEEVFAHRDILQAQYPVFKSSMKANDDDRDVIEYLCKVSLQTTKYIEVLVAHISDSGLTKHQCLACNAAPAAVP